MGCKYNNSPCICTVMYVMNVSSLELKDLSVNNFDDGMMLEPHNSTQCASIASYDYNIYISYSDMVQLVKNNVSYPPPPCRQRYFLIGFDRSLVRSP
jgi:hypothetical protein